MLEDHFAGVPEVLNLLPKKCALTEAVKTPEYRL